MNNNEAMDMSSIRAMVMEDFYKNSEQRLQEQQVKIATLRKASNGISLTMK